MIWFIFMRMIEINLKIPSEITSPLTNPIMDSETTNSEFVKIHIRWARQALPYFSCFSVQNSVQNSVHITLWAEEFCLHLVFCPEKLKKYMQLISTYIPDEQRIIQECEQNSFENYYQRHLCQIFCSHLVQNSYHKVADFSYCLLDFSMQYEFFIYSLFRIWGFKKFRRYIHI